MSRIPKDADRCTTIKRSDGVRCKNPHLPGVDVCKFHGGTLPNVKAKSERARVAAEMQALSIKPVAADHPQARGDAALAVEIRRTIGWIEYCEAQLLDLGVAAQRGDPTDELADVLGGLQLVAKETVSGTERGEDTSLSTQRYAAGVNVWEEKLRWNRHHLAGLTKQWINAGFEAKRLELAARTIDVLERTIDGIIRDLGRNPRDADIRAIVKRRLTQALESGDDTEGGSI